VKTVSIGPITTKTMTELGLSVTVESSEAGVDHMAQALVKAVSS